MISTNYQNFRLPLVVATAVSVAVHLCLLFWFADVRLTPQFRTVTPHPKIEVIIQQPPSSNAESVQLKASDYEPIAKTDSTSPAASKAASIKQTSQKTSTNTTQLKENSHSSGLTIYGNLKQFAETFNQTDNAPEGAFNPDSVFSPELQEKLNDRKAKQSSKEYFQQAEQLKKDNEYYEFAGAGDTRIVRIDGNCFIQQDKNPLDEFQNPIMLSAGDCSKKKEINFTPYAPHIKNAEKRYDRR